MYYKDKNIFKYIWFMSHGVSFTITLHFFYKLYDIINYNQLKIEYKIIKVYTVCLSLVTPQILWSDI